eukprot:CAMPEP_0172531612 /NCGR_PEP_ID=MMETSP1067-20121228/4947_1 /TAXON_ID=265564 ORGANISM="Thalassiosira punctigera, Strain Tpunct2005C2" /NCGR_SAMPLE_ID=MMETSP1067 /ASSEMBLY_ACC=CAM_ASM_000444 /LENGTH=409 /DNA_ID=CAMNT_0013316009 /DNA_START=117 /DNA_END=1346 /DNA_ORIENTATION=+
MPHANSTFSKAVIAALAVAYATTTAAADVASPSGLRRSLGDGDDHTHAEDHAHGDATHTHGDPAAADHHHEHGPSCPSELTNPLVFDDDATLYYAVVPGLLCGRLEVDQEGWIAFAVSPGTGANKMSGANAIIGIPATGTVLKYDLAYPAGGGSATPMIPDKQTLKMGQVRWDGSKTIMEFAKVLEEPDEVPITPGEDNTLLHARGGDILGYHSFRTSQVVKLPTPSLVAPVPDEGAAAQLASEPASEPAAAPAPMDDGEEKDDHEGHDDGDDHNATMADDQSVDKGNNGTMVSPAMVEDHDDHDHGTKNGTNTEEGKEKDDHAGDDGNDHSGNGDKDKDHDHETKNGTNTEEGKDKDDHAGDDGHDHIGDGDKDKDKDPSSLEGESGGEKGFVGAFVVSIAFFFNLVV